MLLADLPDELLISVLLYLRAEDLYRCIRLSKRIAGIIQGTPRLRYYALLDLYGLEDNEECRADVNEKMEALLLREDAYLHFKYRFDEIQESSDGYPSIYDLSSGRLFIGNEGVSMSVKSAKLPTEAGQRMTWSEIFVGQSICDFSTSVDEHDLIACVVSSPTPDGLWCNIDVAFYQLSGQPHPEAQRPQIHILQVNETWGQPSVSIEIVGDTLAVIIYYAFDFEHAGSRLFLFAWRTGVALNPGGQPATNLGLCFLTPDLLLHPNEEKLALEVFRVPEEPAGPDLELVCELGYPDFQPDAEIYNTVCRGDPNPSLSHAYSPGTDRARPFRARTEDSVVLVFMTWRHEPGDNEEALSLVFHRSTVLRHVDRDERVVPWKDWGPEGARWLCMSKMSYTYITTTSGQRYVQKPATGQHTPDQPIHVLDFNPYTVRCVEAQLVQQAEEAGGRNRAQEVMLDTPTAIITLSADHEPGRPSSTDQRKDYTGPWKSWLDDAFGRFCNPPEVISNSNLIFADASALAPGLPFVRTISKQKFRIVAVVMDNERIIGMSTDWVANTTILRPFYFG